MHPISIVLKTWYQKNKRELPWRNINDPYIIWLSEIILQQTRVEQGLPYFEKFSRTFPTVEHFAEAHEDKILKMWQGLGYYTRARNMHYTAKEIVKKYDGNFPDDFSELKKLKGIGEYTAAAITSFAFNKPHAVVDGNIYRFLSRYFGIKTPVDSTKGKKEFFVLATRLLDKKSPAVHNQAIMEFGAMQCKPFPDCQLCPFNGDCFAFLKNKVKQFPVKLKTHKTKDRFFNYLFIKWKNKIFLNKRTGNDIWKNLFEFPLIETNKKITAVNLMKSQEWKTIFGTSGIHIHSISHEYKHQLSHQTIHARFYEIRLKTKPYEQLSKKSIQIPVEDLEHFGISRLIEKFLNNI